MATPHTAGIALLVRQSHPSWGPIAVKGAMMANADPTKVGNFSVLRGGAGLVSAPDAADSVAYISTPDGRDNLAFGFQELHHALISTRSVSITNTSNAPITYAMSAKTNTLGLTKFTVSFNQNTITVPAHASRNVVVTLRLLDPQDLPDATADDGGGLAAISGLVWATPTKSAPGVHALKTPLVLVPYGVSDIRAFGLHTNGTTGGPQAVNNILLANTGVHTGTYDTYQWSITDPVHDNGDPKVPDIRDVGVQQFNLGAGFDLAVFAISDDNRTPTQAVYEYDVNIDTNGDGIPDFLLVGADNGLVTSGQPDGLLATFLVDLHLGAITDAFSASAPANGGIVELPLILEDLGPLASFHFWVDGYTVLDLLAPDETSVALYDPTNPAVSTGDFGTLTPGQLSLLPVTSNSSAAAQQGALGWLVVSIDDAGGPREANRVPLRANRADR
jgi:hypothetical protein